MKTVLQEMHDCFCPLGICKTYSLIRRYYYWPKMTKHIQTHIDSCSLCKQEKMQAGKYQLQTTEIPNRAFAKVSIYLIVEMPTSHYGNKNILVMVDHLIRWPMVKAIPDKEATTVANGIFDKLILEHVSPEILCLIIKKNCQMTVWPMSARSLELNNFLLPLTLPDLMERRRIFRSFSRPQ